MQEASFDAHLERRVQIDICHACQSFWFDVYESATLTPGATLSLFRIIGEKIAQTSASRRRPGQVSPVQGPSAPHARHAADDEVRVSELSARARPADDLLRLSPREGLHPPADAEQIEDLRRNVQSVNCANCGAPVDVTVGAACAHCASPLSMLDLKQAERLVEQLQKAEIGRSRGSIPRCPSSSSGCGGRPSERSPAFATTTCGRRSHRRQVQISTS